MTERGVSVDHSTINRWVNKFSSLLEAEARKRRNPVGTSWRLDETYIRVTGKWKYFFRAVDKDGKTIDFLLTAKRDERAARRFLAKAIGNSGAQVLITVDKSGANHAAIMSYNTDTGSTIEI